MTSIFVIIPYVAPTIQQHGIVSYLYLDTAKTKGCPCQPT